MLIVGIILVLILISCFVMSKIEEREEERIGYIFDYICTPGVEDKYKEYYYFYKCPKEDNLVPIETIEWGKQYYQISSIMLIGTLEDSGMTEIVFYTDGEDKVTTKENLEELIKRIYDGEN